MSESEGAVIEACRLCGGVEELEATSLGQLCAACLLVCWREGARVERAARVRRLNESRAEARERGLWHSGPAPYGYRSRGFGVLEPVPAELAVCAWICGQRARGYGWQKLADALNEAGTPGPRGGGWSPSSVRRVALRGSERPAGVRLEGRPLADRVGEPLV